LHENRLEVVTQSLLEGVVMTSTLTFDGEQVDLELQDNRGVRGRLRGGARN
jgi:hypothetical protein